MLRRKLTILRRIIHRVNLFHFLVTILLVLLFSTGYLVRELLTKSPFQQDVAPSNKTKSCSRYMNPTILQNQQVIDNIILIISLKKGSTFGVALDVQGRRPVCQSSGDLLHSLEHYVPSRLQTDL